MGKKECYFNQGPFFCKGNSFQEAVKGLNGSGFVIP